MNDKDIPAGPQSGPLLGLGSSDGLGPGSEAARLVEYLKGYPRTDGTDAAIRVLSEQVVEIERLKADRDSWMQQASDRAQDALDLVAAERKHWRTMLSPQHVFRGSCPDAQNWHDRDPECPACRALGDWTA